MKVIIAGTRNFDDYERLHRALFALVDLWEVTEFVSGGCSTGADALGERFAGNYKKPVKWFPADWSGHGKAAGPIRNAAMAEYADELVAFWDGESRGTFNMIREMRKRRKPVSIIFLEAPSAP